MKLLVVFATLVLAACALQITNDQWKEFKKTYGKSYRSLKEEKLRFDIFKDNVRMIEEHNAAYARGEKTYTMAVNKFADLTAEEFKAQFLTFKKPELRTTKTFYENATLKVADAMDWRSSGAVLAVKDQGQCGGCWAFSCTGSLEGQNYLVHGVQISLSEQELLDCSTGYGNNGCNGGVMEYGFEYIRDYGVATESDYPYEAVDDYCRDAPRANVQISGYTDVQSTETALQQAAGSVGPISVAINADTIGYYSGGVFYDASCSQSVNHGVLVVGYGTEDGLDYWLIKNSWGASWGDGGYFKLARNQGQMCAIGSWNVYPNVI